MGTAAIIAMSFFNVSGGPWGSEDVFSAGGPVLGCIGIIVFAVLFSLPQCLLTAELSCAFPRNGGYAVWVREALGDFWGVQEVYWQWVSGVADAALYPALLCDTVLQLCGLQHLGTLEVWLSRVAVAFVMSSPAFFSVQAVPGVLIHAAVGALLPVVAFVVYGLFVLPPPALFAKAFQSASPAWPAKPMRLMHALFWNLEGWDCVAACTAEMRGPLEQTLPRGLFCSLAITTCQYLLVLVVAAGVSQESLPWQSWTDGSLVVIGASLGPCMACLLFTASCIGNVGMFLSEFTEDSFLLLGAAEIGITPAIFARRCPGAGTPVMANIFQLSIIAAMLAFDFDQILVFDNFFTGMAVALQFASFARLRLRRPELDRPFRVPAALCALFVPAVAFLAVMLYQSLVHAGSASQATGAALALGIPYGLWVALQEWRCRQAAKPTALDVLLQDD